MRRLMILSGEEMVEQASAEKRARVAEGRTASAIGRRDQTRTSAGR